MPQANRLTFPQYRPTEMMMSDVLRQNQLKARLEAGDDGLNRSSREQLSHAFTDRYYRNSALKRSAVISRLYRQSLNEARQVKGNQLGSQALDIAAAPIQQGTSKLLQQAWLNLIDSFGLTLIWINIHVILRFIIGEKFFCKLGHEWLATGATGKSATGTQSTRGILGLGGDSIGILEVGLLLLVDLAALAILIVSIALNALVVYIIVHPVQSFWEFYGLDGFMVMIKSAFGIVGTVL